MRLLVVDGNSVVNRAFYGIRPLTTKDGQFTNAIYGFLTMLFKIKNDEKPDAVAIAFDLKAPTFRHKAYSGYKATRKGMPNELASQMPILKELLALLGYKIVTCEGYEADDILGTLARSCEQNGNECVLATGDRDSLQLVSDKTSVHLCTNKQDIIYTPEKVKEDYGVTPSELIEIKAIQGDASDNIPGVAGIGPKGAGDLIQRFHSVEYIYEHIDEIDVKDGVRSKLKNSKENAIMSRMLGEICCTVPVDTDINSYRVNLTDPDACARYMAKLELFSLIEKIGLNNVPVKEEKKTELKKLEVVENAEDKILFENIKKIGKAYFYAEFSNKELKSFAVLNEGIIYVSRSKSLFKDILSYDNIEKFTRNSKSIFAYADRNEFEVRSLVFDVELAAYLLEPSSKDYLDQNLCANYDIELPYTDYEEHKKYAPLGVYDVLCEKLMRGIKSNEQEKLLSEIEIPLADVLAKMENVGFDVDKNGIEEYGKQRKYLCKSNIDEIEKYIKRPKKLEKSITVDKDIFKSQKRIDLLINDINEKVAKKQFELAIDRLHTFFKGYIEVICEQIKIDIKDKSLDALYGELLKYIHDNELFEEGITKDILSSSKKIMKSFDYSRNNKSFAHTNDIMKQNEAEFLCMYVIDLYKFLCKIKLSK